MTETAKHRYSLAAMLFHWVIAVAVIWNWRLAENAEHAATRSEAIAIFADHKALGITILVLTLGRIAWRLTHKIPPLPANYKTWERVLARTTHLVFYILLIGLPIGGWLANSLAGRSIDMFGLFTMPPLPVGENSALAETIFGIHGTGGEIMVYLVALHILGALKHTFFDRDGGIFRMLPFGKVGGAPARTIEP
ncbi:Cytochrome b561 like protein [Alteripontixanthobacter maritimus]|uniref:Cytochrome b561 like protein n=1 Tax=Alteripontixanthobacter maritimus TaxID=2161824 RepID=A0A369QBU5_9SPHN|nr:cytochrome b [Alteripontixanthobacter maritimus]RDC60389.1 Cytochrome b561 like protein [Alteripontixanthobacter maritimus]